MVRAFMMGKSAEVRAGGGKTAAFGLYLGLDRAYRKLQAKDGDPPVNGMYVTENSDAVSKFMNSELLGLNYTNLARMSLT